MRKVLGLFILGLCVFRLVWAEEAVADSRVWDFGQVKQDRVLKHDFTFTNETNLVLNITGVNTSCGCTASQAGKKILQPGESTVINVAFNSHGYLGPVKQFVYVNTDHPDLSVVKFSISCEVIK